LTKCHESGILFLFREARMEQSFGSRHILTATLVVVDEQGNKWGETVEHLEVKNIPKAWELKRAEPRGDEIDQKEQLGIGVSRNEAVVDWFYKNHGSKRFANLQDPSRLCQEVDGALKALLDFQQELRYRGMCN